MNVLVPTPPWLSVALIVTDGVPSTGTGQVKSPAAVMDMPLGSPAGRLKVKG